MREYENPQKHFQRHIQRSADRYMDGLNRAGMKPTPILTRAMSERAAQEARDDYRKHLTAVRDHNIRVIMRNHNKRLKKIKREGASLRLKTCPPIAACFGAMTWYSFIQARWVPHGNSVYKCLPCISCHVNPGRSIR